MRVLGIDSSCSAASVAVVNDGMLEMEIFLSHKLQHSVVLFPMIQDMLQKLEITVDDLDAVAVSGGPGSFTGLRIGAASAKGICQGAKKKFIGVSSLDAMAYQQYGFDGIICPIMDALRDNVYTGLFRFEKGELVKVKDYDALHIDDLLKVLGEYENEKIMFCGDGVRLQRDKIQECLKDRACFAAMNDNMPRASSIAELGLMRLNQGQEDDIYNYVPIYLRKSQAEREYERKQAAISE